MKVIVIGGGASGMAAALCAGRDGHDVTVLEQNDRVGRKLLATGNGRCNLSNADLSLSHYHGLKDSDKSRAFAGSVFERFDGAEVLSFFHDLGLNTKNRDGYIYPASEQASAVLDVLRFAMENEGIRVCCNHAVTGLTKTADGFSVHTSEGDRKADAVILSCGSKAWIKKGDKDGYDLAASMGHSIIGPVPALTALVSDEKIFKPLAGIRIRGKITLYTKKQDTVSASDTGELQFTSYGISGIPTMQVSHVAAKAFLAKESVYAVLDLLPDVSREECLQELEERCGKTGYKSADQFLIGWFHKNLGLHFMKQAGIPLQKQASDLDREELKRLIEAIKCMRIPVHQTRSFADAQVCAGGVPVDEVLPTLESGKCRNLFLTGEILDVHGDCGGYNLQWAFSSGLLAGMLGK
ncbi:MAG: aminoacetone oxidase family FAD-binding enzyme [Lachnospiraceae bacterium]|nr:aminoacetone oxidase family FAD-binding enzyme [Lachnospiraceae bacterium]